MYFIFSFSAGGLVTAVAPVVVQGRGLWVGWPGVQLDDPNQPIPEPDPSDFNPTSGLKSSQVSKWKPFFSLFFSFLSFLYYIHSCIYVRYCRTCRYTRKRTYAHNTYTMRRTWQKLKYLSDVVFIIFSFVLFTRIIDALGLWSKSRSDITMKRRNLFLQEKVHSVESVARISSGSDQIVCMQS